MSDDLHLLKAKFVHQLDQVVSGFGMQEYPARIGCGRSPMSTHIPGDDTILFREFRYERSPILPRTSEAMEQQQGFADPGSFNMDRCIIDHDRSAMRCTRHLGNGNGSLEEKQTDDDPGHVSNYKQCARLEILDLKGRWSWAGCASIM